MNEVEVISKGILKIKNIDPDDNDLVCFFGKFSDRTNYDAVRRLVSENIEEIRLSNPSEYIFDHLDSLLEIIQSRITEF